MPHPITLELAQRTNALARQHHPDFYTSLHTVVADLPPTPETVGGPYATRAVKVWFAEAQQVLQVVYADSTGDDAALLDQLAQGLEKWAALGEDPADRLPATEAQATELRALAGHPLTSAADRLALLDTLLGWHSRKGARDLAADLTAKVEARSPGIISGVGWMPHGPAEPRPSPHPFPAA